MAPYCCPCLEQSATCFILSPCWSSLAFLALCAHLLVPSHLLLFKVQKLCPHCPFPFQVDFSQGSQTKLSWRSRGSEPAGLVTVH